MTFFALEALRELCFDKLVLLVFYLVVTIERLPRIKDLPGEDLFLDAF